MVFGYSTNAFVKYQLVDAVARIARLGFRGVEIMADRPHLYPPDTDETELQRLQQALASGGLKVTNLNSFTLFAVGDTYLPSWIEPERHRREIRIRHTRDCLRLARRLGCASISVPPGGPLSGVTRGEAERLFYEGIEPVAALAEELDVRLLVEPEPGLMIETTRQFQEFMRGVRSPAVGVNFALDNLIMTAGSFLAVGANSYIARLLGARDDLRASQVLSTAVFSALLSGSAARQWM